MRGVESEGNMGVNGRKEGERYAPSKEHLAGYRRVQISQCRLFDAVRPEGPTVMIGVLQ